MVESRMRRAAQALRDPWGLLAAAVGAGSAWAVGLPLVGIGGVGVGMLAVAAGVGSMIHGQAVVDQDSNLRMLRQGTEQYRLVETLRSYCADLSSLNKQRLGSALASQASSAVAAGETAKTSATEVALAIDSLDGALGRAGEVVRQMSSVERVAGPVERMVARRQQLLDKLTAGVDGVGELYTKLLELSTTADLPPIDGPDPVAEVNESLDAIRGAFADLETDARRATAHLRPGGDAFESG